MKHNIILITCALVLLLCGVLTLPHEHTYTEQAMVWATNASHRIVTFVDARGQLWDVEVDNSDETISVKYVYTLVFNDAGTTTIADDRVVWYQKAL